MPEGDTIHHAARRIRAVLLDRVPEQIRHAAAAPPADRWPERLAGQGRARGRRARQAPVPALRRRADAALAPAHDRRVGRPPRGRALAARARAARGSCCAAGEWEVVQFDGPVLELMSEARARFDPRLAALGPDVIGERFDERRRSCARLRAAGPDAPDRRRAARPAIVAGIGNMWKAEACFAAASTPGGRSAACSDEEALAVVALRARADAPRRPTATASARARAPSTGARGCRARAAARRSAATGRATTTAYLLVPGLPALRRRPSLSRAARRTAAPARQRAALRRARRACARPCAATARRRPRRSPAGRGCARRTSSGGSRR